MKVDVPSTSAVSEPRTTATATTDLSRFLNCSALGAYQIDCRCRDCPYVYVGIGHNTKRKMRKTITAWYARECIYLHPLALDLRSQASSPSNHMWSAFLLPAPPQFLYQAPPGAQQLTLPDFLNVPHFGHIMLLVEAMRRVLVLTGLVIGARTIFSSRSPGNGSKRVITCRRLVVNVHHIYPREAVNMDV